MATKFHITKKGEPGYCSAKYSCPLGDSDAHYDSKEAAQAAYEAKMVAQLVPTSATKSELSASQLSGLAKVSSDPEVIEEVLTRGSDRALKNLAKNPNLTEAQLAMAYSLEKASEATRSALAGHPNFPISQMSVSEWADQVEANTNSTRVNDLLASDAVTDAHLDEITHRDAARLAGSRWGQPTNVQRALVNPYNSLSEARVVELGEKSWSNIGRAMESNRYPAERIVGLSKDLIYWGNIDHTSNPAYLTGYADWAIANKEEKPHDAEYIATRVATNPETPTEALESLAQNDIASVAVYRNPRASEEVRRLCEFNDPEVGRVVKLDRLQDQFGGKLQEEITYMARTDQPFANRGLYDTRVRFNVERMAELGLDKEDIMTLMGRGKFNGGVFFDQETGVFRGTVDSTD